MSAIMFYMPLSYFCVVLTAKIDNINGNCKRRCERNSIPKKSSLSGWRGVPSHKRAREHDNFKSEDLLFLKSIVQKYKVHYYIQQTNRYLQYLTYNVSSFKSIPAHFNQKIRIIVKMCWKMTFSIKWFILYLLWIIHLSDLVDMSKVLVSILM